MKHKLTKTTLLTNILQQRHKIYYKVSDMPKPPTLWWHKAKLFVCRGWGWGCKLTYTPTTII